MYANSQQEYKGYYWKTSSGKIFSGKTPQDYPIKLLIPMVPTYEGNNEDLLYKVYTNGANYYLEDNVGFMDYNINEIYYSLKNINISNKILVPTYFPNIPTEENYTNSEYTRYFCKKINELIYIEISKKTYDDLVNKNPTISYDYYQPFNISWKLTGDKNNVYNVNKNIVTLIMKNQKLPMFDKYLNEDYLKYYK